MLKNTRTLSLSAALCGVLAALIFRRNLSAEYALFFSSAGKLAASSGVDANIVKTFALFHDRPLIAFIAYNFFDAVNALLVSVLLWPFLRIQRRKTKLLGILLMAADVLSPFLFFWSNRSVELCFLSRQYFRSHHFEEKLPYLDAGREILRQLFDANSAVAVVSRAALALLLLTGLSLALLRVGAHRKDWLGVAGNGIALAYFPALALAPRYAALPAALSTPFLVVWYCLLAFESLRPLPRSA